MKKIAMILHCGTVGGSGLGLLTTAKMLRDRYDIVVYCPARPKDIYRRFEAEGFAVKAHPAPLPTYGYFNGGPALLTNSCCSALWEQEKCIPAWRREFEQEGIDVLLANSIVLSWMYRCVEGLPCKTICHVREVLRSKRTFLGRRILRELENFDMVWYISDYEMERHALSHPKKAIVRDCLLDDQAAAVEPARGGEENDFRVLYVGGASKLKGFPTLIRAARRLDDKITVRVAGYLSCAKPGLTPGNLLYFTRFFQYFAMRRALEDAKAQKNVELLGFCPDLNALFAECDALVFPSSKAHQARPAFEAGVYAKPVIISDFPDTRDNVRDGENGVTFKPNSPRALAKAIDRLAGDPELCRRLGEKNREMALTYHTYEKVSEAVQAAMEELL